MTLGFLTPDPHLNRNQPRVRQRKHPSVGGLATFSAPGNFTCNDGREREREREGQEHGARAPCFGPPSPERRAPLQKVAPASCRPARVEPLPEVAI